MKKGISPLIATILIVGFTIVLAALVMRWTGTFFTTTTTETSEASEVAITCVSNIQFSVQNSCIEGNKIKLLLKNEGQDIQSFIVQVAGGEAQTTETLTGLAIYSSDTFIANYTSIPYTSLPNEIERVKIFPKILVNGEEQVCSEINYVPSNLKTCVDSDTVGYWSFDGNAEDSSGNGNDGSLLPQGTGPTFSDGVLGRATDLDGIDDYVDVSHSSSITVTGQEITMEAWIYPRTPTSPLGSEPGAGYSFLIKKRDAQSGYYLILMGESNAGKLQASVGQSTSTVYATGTTVLQPNTWYHVVAVYKQNQYFKIYLNGKDDTSSSTSTVTIGSSTSPLQIGIPGWWGPPNDVNFNGKIDEVRISNVARTF